MKQGHLGTVEATLCLTYINPMLIFYNLPRIYIERAQTGAWLLCLCTGVFSLIMFAGTFALLKKYPGKSIVEIGDELGGVPGRAVVSTVNVMYHLFIMVIFASSTCNYLMTMILPTTPMYYVYGALILCVLFLCYMGLEAFSRTIMVLTPFVIIGMLLILFLSLDKADFTHLNPMPGTPLLNLFVQSIILTPLVYDGIWLAIIPPYLRKGKSVFKLFAWASIFSTLMMTGIMLVLQANFFYPSGEHQPFPVFQLVRLIHIGEFIQRIESIYVIMLTVLLTIHLGLIFTGAVLALGQGLKLTDWHPLILPLGIIVFAVAFILPPGAQLVDWYYRSESVIIAIGIKLALPFALLALAFLKRGSGSSA